MFSEARNIVCDTQRRTNYDNVVSYNNIFLLSEHILDHKGLDQSILDKIRSESYT